MPPSATPLERVLQASLLFGAVPDTLVSEFARQAVRRRFQRGEYLWRVGQEASAFTIIATGLVKITQPAPDGTEAIVALFGPRESVGDLAVISRGCYPANAVAASEYLDIISVSKDPVLAALERNMPLAQSLQKSLVEHSEALRHKIKIMTAGSVPCRLATLLLHLADRFGDEIDEGVSVGVALSRAELACLVGATVETTIRFMSKWQKAGLLSTTDQGFVLHQVNELQSVAAGSA